MSTSRQIQISLGTIVKKLPAVLIAAVGISFGFTGTALADILVEKTLAPGESLDFYLGIEGMGNDKKDITICFQTTDNLPTKILIVHGYDDPPNFVDASPEKQCVTSSINNGRSGSVDFPRFMGNLPGGSKAVRVTLTQPALGDIDRILP